MTTKPKHSTYLCCLLLSCMQLTGGCGVEVGNPHGGKGGAGSTTTSGTVSVALADAPIDDVKNVYFNLKSLSVVAIDGTSYDLALATTGKVDALALRNGKSLALATGQSLPAGDYAAAILELDEALPATIVDNTGKESPLPFASGSHALHVTQAFTVEEGGALDLVLHVDLRASLTQLTDVQGKRGFKFGPQASLLPKDIEASLSGTLTDKTVTQVCAYLQRGGGFVPGDRLPQGVPGGYREPPAGAPGLPDTFRAPPPPKIATQARVPRSFEQGVEFDELATCDNAFTTASVSDGAFSMHHLWPGQYYLRFFKADGTYLKTTLQKSIEVTAGQAAKASF